MENLTYNNKLWPLSRFYFNVNFGASMQDCPFQEVLGLDVESQILEYKKGNSLFCTDTISKLVGINKITFKKGIMKVDDSFLRWCNAFTLNNVKEEKIRVELLNDSGKIMMIWNLINAFPTKIIVNELKGKSKEVSVESIEITHESLTLTNA